MPDCPRCSQSLQILRDEQGQRWLCSSCGGEALSLPRVQRTAGALVHEDLQRSIAHSQRSELHCPGCTGRMQNFRARGWLGPELDACKRCALVWFDREEWRRACEDPARTESGEELEERSHLAQGMLALETARLGSQLGRTQPDALREWIPALLGAPWELEDAAGGRAPWMTWGAMLLIAVTSLVAVRDELLMQNLQLSWVQIAAHAWHALFTYTLVHQHWLWVLPNLALFFVVGDDAERVLGIGRFSALLLASTLAGALVFLAGPWWNPDGILRGTGPLVSGLLVFYGLRFPDAPLGFFATRNVHWASVRARALSWRLQARTFLIGWAVLQLVYLLIAPNVTATNLGGGLAGAACWFCFRRFDARD